LRVDGRPVNFRRGRVTPRTRLAYPFIQSAPADPEAPISSQRISGTVALCLACVPAVASAEAYSVDIELVRPTFSQGHLFGVDSPIITKQGELRYGTFLMYEHAPLVIYEFDEPNGTVVGNRIQDYLGVSYDAYPNMSLRLTLPLALQWGGVRQEWEANSPAGLGDIGIGARWMAVNAGPLAAGLRVDLFAPTSTSRSYLGERTPRFEPGLLASLGFGPAELLVDVGANLRELVETNEDFQLGSELKLSGGLRYFLSPEKLALGLTGISHAGFTELYGGGAENTLESVAGVQLWPKKGVQVDLGAGRGFVQGYGTTQLRVVAGLTFTRIPEEPAVIQQQVVNVIEVPVAPPEEPEEPEWKPGELAKIQKSQIVIKDPIQFELDTSNILPESFPTLQYVADLLNQNSQIVHLLIEGHASEEGSYEYNYDLSMRRANAIWERLVLMGVHPSRMSTRSMGEVVPVEMGSEEKELAANRRVEFHIIRTLDPLEVPPEYAPTIQLPWNGQTQEVQKPTEKLPQMGVEQKPVEKFDVQQFKEQIEEEEGSDEAAPPAAPPAEAAPPADTAPAPDTTITPPTTPAEQAPDADDGESGTGSGSGQP
jgi:outer membrane protein OmpA-like peptidoglycan-associated protein